MAELIEDLTGKFLESHEPGDERAAVEDYGHYFLGSIIISDRDGQKFIIDGQQRLTSLTLLLIYLHRQLEDAEQKGQLADLIFSQKYGKRSFNLDVAGSHRLHGGAVYRAAIRRRRPAGIGRQHPRPLQDIEEQFPEELKGPALPYFVDWLIENVHLVEITAYSDEDAYTIFETMNDRGLSLTPTDMLKGYLLANITEPEIPERASKVWRERIAECRSWARKRTLTPSRHGCAASTPKDP